MEGWAEREIEGCEFPGKRSRGQFQKLLALVGEKVGAALPAACQDWAVTKAAHRFFSNREWTKALSWPGTLPPQRLAWPR